MLLCLVGCLGAPWETEACIQGAFIGAAVGEAAACCPDARPDPGEPPWLEGVEQDDYMVCFNGAWLGAYDEGCLPDTASRDDD